MHDCISENAETEVWLDISLEFKHLSTNEHKFLIGLNTEVGKLLRLMLNNPEKFA